MYDVCTMYFQDCVGSAIELDLRKSAIFCEVKQKVRLRDVEREKGRLGDRVVEER